MGATCSFRRLFKHNAASDEPKAVASKGKNKAKSDNADAKRKAPAVLAVEPERKYKRNDSAPQVDNRPFHAFHQMHPMPPRTASSWRGSAGSASRETARRAPREAVAGAAPGVVAVTADRKSVV